MGNEALNWDGLIYISLKFKLNYALLLENIPFCNNPAELTDLETYFM